MLHQYKTSQVSADRILWDRLDDDKRKLLRWAEENKTSHIDGERANALHVLYNYYMCGWCGLPQDPVFSKKCLKEAANLGHAKAIYDFTRDVLCTPEMEQAKQYIHQALEHNKLDDTSFDFSFNHYKQASMKQELKDLLQSIDTISALPPIKGSIINKGNMNITSIGVEFDDVDLYGIDLKGSIPLSPRTKDFLESKGNMVIQENGKITFAGDFFNAFSKEEVAIFLAQKSASRPQPL
jgi:hypothetical protein